MIDKSNTKPQVNKLDAMINAKGKEINKDGDAENFLKVWLLKVIVRLS